MSSPAPEPGGYREMLRLAWPLIISNGSFTLMTFIDRVFLAQYSSISIQAALPAGILSFTLICGFMAVAGYANTFVAQYFGAKDLRGCSRATAQAVWLSFLSWPLILLLIPLGRGLLRASGHGPAVLEEELAYFNILMFGGVTVPLGAAIGSFFTGRGDTRTNMVAQIAGNLVNIVLDYALIFGRWGFPELGIRGAAIATVIAGVVAPGIQFALYFSRRIHAEYGTRSTLNFDATLFRRMIRFGLPSGWHLFLDIASFSTFVLLTGRMGAEALAASNIGFSINTVGFMPLIGISIAASTVIGQYQGRKMPDISEKAGWTALKIGVTYMAAVAVTYIAFPAAYFGWFVQRGGGGISLETLLETGRVMLWMMAAWGLLDAANLVLAFALKGAGDTRFVMWYQSIMSWGLLVPGQWLIAGVYHGTILQSWAWLTVYVWLLSIGFFIRFRSGKWKTIEVIEPVPPIVPTRPGSEAMGMVE